VATVTGSAAAARAARPRRRSFPVWRWVILLIAAGYFIMPLATAQRFAGLASFSSVFTQDGFGTSIWLSARLAIMTTLITLALMVPTTVYVHLRLPRLRGLPRLSGLTRLRGRLGRIVGADRLLRPHPRRPIARPGVRHPGHAVRLPGDRRGPARD